MPTRQLGIQPSSAPSVRPCPRRATSVSCPHRAKMAPNRHLTAPNKANFAGGKIYVRSSIKSSCAEIGRIARSENKPKQTQFRSLSAHLLSCPHPRLPIYPSTLPPIHRLALSSSAPNKANSPRFRLENAARAKKQTQSNPIAAGVLSEVERISEAILSEAQRSRMDPAGVLIQPLALSGAPAESNGAVEWIYPRPHSSTHLLIHSFTPVMTGWQPPVHGLEWLAYRAIGRGPRPARIGPPAGRWIREALTTGERS
jgi:hypothetical protein